MQTDDHFRRIRSLIASLECVLSAMDGDEGTASASPTCVGAATFLLTELKDALDGCETALIEGTGQ